MFSLLLQRLLESMALAGRMLREIVFRFLNQFRFAFQRATSIVTIVGRKIPTFLQSLTSVTKKPTKREDFIETKRMFVSKSFLILVVAGIILIIMLWFTLIWPLIVSKFLTNHLWQQNKKVSTYNGKVVLYYDEDKTIPKFEGLYKNGKANGECKDYDENGNLIFFGDYIDGKREGNGKVYRNNVLIYEGGVSGEQYSGKGNQYLDDGTLLYSGEFQNNQYNGMGSLYFESGMLHYSGYFADGKFNGKGSLYEDTIDHDLVYVGGFEAGQKNGAGKEYDGGVLIYDGEFANDQYNGNGVEYIDQREVYSGGFKNDLYHGDGVLHTQDDIIISGAFEDGYLKDKAVCSYNGMKFYEGGMNRLAAEGMGTFFSTLGTEIYSGEFLLWNINGATLLGMNVSDARERFKMELVEDLGTDGFTLSSPATGLMLFCSYADDDNDAAVKNVYLTPNAQDKTLKKMIWPDVNAYDETARLTGKRNDYASGRGVVTVSPDLPMDVNAITEDGMAHFRAYPQDGGAVMVYWFDSSEENYGKLLFCEWLDSYAGAEFIANFADSNYITEDGESEDLAGGEKDGAGGSASDKDAEDPEVKEVVKKLGLDDAATNTENSKLNQVLMASKADGNEYDVLSAFITCVGETALKQAAEDNIAIYQGLISDESKKVLVGKGSKATVDGWQKSLDKCNDVLSDAELNLIDAEKTIIKASGRSPKEFDIESSVFITDPSKFDAAAMAQAASEHQLKSAREEAERQAADEQTAEEEAEEEKKEAAKVQIGVPVAKRNTGDGAEDKGYTVAVTGDQLLGKNIGPGAKDDNADDSEDDSSEEAADSASEIAVDFKPDIDDINKKIELHMRTLNILYKDVDKSRDAYSKTVADRKKVENSRSTGNSTTADLKLADIAVNDAKAELINSSAAFTAELLELDKMTGGYISKNTGWFSNVLPH